MQVVTKDFHNVSRLDTFTIIPIGDIHIGSAACDEKLFLSVINAVKEDDSAYIILMGDICEWINVRDPRFDVSVLAPWIETKDLIDLAKAQKERFLDAIRPVAHKVLAFVEGNHERTIKLKTERDIYSEMVAEVKGLGKLDNETRIGLGPYGWLLTKFRRSGKKDKKQSGTHTVRWNIHHGFAGGKLAGGKALNMQRWLWTHNADIVLFGHSHNVGIQAEAVEEIDSAGNVETVVRRGAFTGTFLKTVQLGASTYSEQRGYFPTPIGGVKITLQPRSYVKPRRIRMTYEA